MPDGTTQIPAGIVDLESYRRWVKSDDFPERGRFAFLHGTIWVDLSKQPIFTHSAVTTHITVGLDRCTVDASLGYYFSSGVLLSSDHADFATEPDGTFVSFGALKDGRLRLIEGATRDYDELEGSPDIVLEVVSDSSVRKDTVILPDLYWRAGIAEYWRVDARRAPLRFDILRHGRRGYTVTRRQAGGWLRSNVLDRSFRLTQEADPLGNPLYTLEVRP